ncbi:laccase-12-like [Dorcoceras hygrometricum]|uniref:Laccase-12-like n=1 Tax=Dorcoceras hygrometricum TaxID=472368 RepID=A0A2Z7BQR8_9LAMI|nr:laccase-12-like [Dorcoceras hygrometricum]
MNARGTRLRATATCAEHGARCANYRATICVPNDPRPTTSRPVIAQPVFSQLSCWRLGAWLRPVSRGNRHFTVGGGRLRQSGPRPEGRLLRQSTLEGLTRSARTDSSKSWPEQIPARGGGARRRYKGEERGGGRSLGARVRCWTWTGPTDEHSVHLHHRDFIVTPIADQIGPIDSVSETEYYDLKNHFSEPQCKMTVFPSTAGNPGIQLAVGPQPLWLRNHNSGLAHRIMVKRLATSPHDPLGITDSACKNQLVVVSVQYGPFNPYIPIRSTTIGKSKVAIDPIAMHTSWRSNSDIASVTSIGYPRMSASGESSTTMYQLLHASGSHPIPMPYDPSESANGSK